VVRWFADALLVWDCRSLQLFTFFSFRCDFVYIHTFIHLTFVVFIHSVDCLCQCQIRPTSGLYDTCDTDKDEGLSAGRGDDDEARRPHVQTGDEVSQQARRVPYGLDHGQLSPAQRSGRRLLYVQVSSSTWSRLMFCS